MEIWKDIPNYEGYYQVSNYGRVKGIERYVKHNWGGLKIIKEKQLKISIDTNGYLFTALCKKGVRKGFQVHQLMAIAFLNHTPCKWEIVVDHVDNNKLNNNLNNLQLISHRENSSKDKKGYSSKYVGVSWNKKSRNWCAKISLNKITYHLGYFNTEAEAKEYYNNALFCIKNNTFENIEIKKPIFSSKYKGVYYRKDTKKYKASIYVGKKTIELGCFKTEIEAYNKRKEYEKNNCI